MIVFFTSLHEHARFENWDLEDNITSLDYASELKRLSLLNFKCDKVSPIEEQTDLKTLFKKYINEAVNEIVEGGRFDIESLLYYLEYEISDKIDCETLMKLISLDIDKDKNLSGSVNTLSETIYIETDFLVFYISRITNGGGGENVTLRLHNDGRSMTFGEACRPMTTDINYENCYFHAIHLSGDYYYVVVDCIEDVFFANDSDIYITNNISKYPKNIVRDLIYNEDTYSLRIN
jgi:hypothetical protein